MKIGIFNEPYLLSFGGTEFCVAVLLEALGHAHEVEILHRKKEMTFEQLERFYGTPLPRAKVIRVPDLDAEGPLPGAAWKRFLVERKRDRQWTEKYDLFVDFTHNPPPYSAARNSALIVLFPFGHGPWVGVPTQHLPFLQRLQAKMQSYFWDRRVKGYQVPLAISEYTREWTAKNWGLDCGILNPPCKTAFPVESKENVILSVGRFTPLKRQRALMQAYRGLEPTLPAAWRYRTIGPLGSDADSVAYHRDVTALAEGTRAELGVNLPRESLDREFSRAAIFWHGAGLDDGEPIPPYMAEHFGITTVEAMAAGCVPVVINKGGQKEIVEHGVSGFLWDTTEQLCDFTQRLCREPELRERMGAAARTRSARFSKESFVRRFKELLAPRVRL